LVLALSSGVGAQTPVSDSDFIFFVPDTVDVPNIPAADSTFTWAVWLENATVLGAVALPVTYVGSPSNVINIDTTVITGSEKGITYGPAGRNSAWTFKTAFTDKNIPGILCGFISFTSYPASNDTLVYLHFKITGGSPAATVIADSGEVNTQHLSITDVIANEQIPTWTKGVFNLGGTAVGDGSGSGITPLAYGLDQNLPNPFNAQTKINFSMPAAGHVKLVVYNVLGQEVVTLLDQKLDANKHEVVWDGLNGQGSTVASGTYFYRLNIGDAYEETRQMTLLK
jgi:hypothetical protein